MKTLKSIKLESIKEGVVLDVKPGDIIVFKSDACLTELAYTRIKDTLANVLPKGCKALIIGRGENVYVMRDAKTIKQ